MPVLEARSLHHKLPWLPRDDVTLGDEVHQAAQVSSSQ